ncbi:hypothetical protein BJY52DRAFT_1292038 [Lactarius psammicola]|nr:hypothetical protein BJY52DRAFT_1292038 [Lactarius psammicola]
MNANWPKRGNYPHRPHLFTLYLSTSTLAQEWLLEINHVDHKQSQFMQCNSALLAGPKGGYSQFVPRTPETKAPTTSKNTNRF